MLLTAGSLELYLFIISSFEGTASEDVPSTDDRVQKAIEYVESMQSDTCNNGVAAVLQLDFDVTVWNQYTYPAIRTANFLSKIISFNGGTLDSLSDEMFFMLVRNNVHGDSLIIGSAIGVEPGIYRGIESVTCSHDAVKRENLISKYKAFCPYAYKSNDTVRSHDLALVYDYLDPISEWYNVLKEEGAANVTLETEEISYRQNMSQLPEVEETVPIAQLSDGHWTKPYYDCGGGNIWMVTYSSPILSVSNGKAVFQGVATIDIEMSSIDINQCDPDDTEAGTALDVFRGTHRCLPTTKCVPVRGLGFVVGAYQCQCKDGFYFPDKYLNIKAYLGEDIEAMYRKSKSISPEMFRCIACAAGCGTCVDGSPCLYERNKPLLYVLTVLMVSTIFGFMAAAMATYIYSQEKVIKSASPLFLNIMCLGGILMCFEFLTVHFDSSSVLCSSRIWLMHLGFFTIYGSLLLKTWRISVIFTVGTYKKVRLPDKVLLQRFSVLMMVVVGFITAWNVSNVPTVDTLKEGSGLKFYVCTFGPWELAFLGVEALFLLYGVYLCFIVRKAPALFNESKHITWAVYNAIILGSVVTLMARFVTSVNGPEFMLLLHFTQIQVCSTMTISFIFIPKFYVIYKKMGGITSGPSFTSISTVSGRVKCQPEFPQEPLPIPPTTQSQRNWDTKMKIKRRLSV